MKKITFLSCWLILSTLFFFACGDDDSNSPNPNPNPDPNPDEVLVPGPEADIDVEVGGFKVVSYGNGVVETIVPGSTYEPLRFARILPYAADLYIPDSKSLSAEALQKRSQYVDMPAMEKSAKSILSYPANMPVTVFFEGKIYLNSIADNIKVTVNGAEVKGKLIFNETFNGDALMTFVPFEAFKANQTVTFQLKNGLKNQGGINTWNSYEALLTYTATAPETTELTSDKWGFEKGNQGIVFIGDGAVNAIPIGSLSAKTGNGFAAISTGDRFVSPNPADEEVCSMMILGPVKENINTITFDYNFVSSQFDPMALADNTLFNDCALMTVVGPKGSYTTIITDVMSVAATGETTAVTGIPGMPEFSQGTYVGQTGWLSRTIDFGSVGSPAYVTFIVTDIGDQLLTSILVVDNVSF